MNFAPGRGLGNYKARLVSRVSWEMYRGSLFVDGVTKAVDESCSGTGTFAPHAYQMIPNGDFRGRAHAPRHLARFRSSVEASRLDRAVISFSRPI